MRYEVIRHIEITDSMKSVDKLFNAFRFPLCSFLELPFEWGILRCVLFGYKFSGTDVIEESSIQRLIAWEH